MTCGNKNKPHNHLLFEKNTNPAPMRLCGRFRAHACFHRSICGVKFRDIMSLRFVARSELSIGAGTSDDLTDEFNAELEEFFGGAMEQSSLSRAND